MDAQIKKRMTMDVKVYPYLNRVDGDKVFGSPIMLKGYICPKTVVFTNRDGVEVKSETTILLDGVDVNKIHNSDEVEIVFAGRVPILRITPYVGLVPGSYELIEVLL